MADPNTAGAAGVTALAALTAWVTPELPMWAAAWVPIVAGAFGGAILAVTERETPRQVSALVVAVRGFVMALLFTGLAVYLLGPVDNGLTKLLLVATAGAIAWRQERLPELVHQLRQWWPGNKGP